MNTASEQRGERGKWPGSWVLKDTWDIVRWWTRPEVEEGRLYRRDDPCKGTEVCKSIPGWLWWMGDDGGEGISTVLSELPRPPWHLSPCLGRDSKCRILHDSMMSGSSVISRAEAHCPWMRSSWIGELCWQPPAPLTPRQALAFAAPPPESPVFARSLSGSWGQWRPCLLWGLGWVSVQGLGGQLHRSYSKAAVWIDHSTDKLWGPGESGAGLTVYSISVPSIPLPPPRGLTYGRHVIQVCWMNSVLKKRKRQVRERDGKTDWFLKGRERDETSGHQAHSSSRSRPWSTW